MQIQSLTPSRTFVSLSYIQIPQPQAQYKNCKGNIIGQGSGSQVPDSAGGDEVSMGVIKKLPRYAHVYTHGDGHIFD